MEVNGIEPLTPACKAGALPAELNLQNNNAWRRPTHKGNPSLQSALRSLTSVFGMGTGVSFSLSPPHWVLFLIELNLHSLKTGLKFESK